MQNTSKPQKKCRENSMTISEGFRPKTRSREGKSKPEKSRRTNTRNGDMDR